MAFQISSSLIGLGGRFLQKEVKGDCSVHPAFVDAWKKLVFKTVLLNLLLDLWPSIQGCGLDKIYENP